jgi:hypothetical protein
MYEPRVICIEPNRPQILDAQAGERISTRLSANGGLEISRD